MADSDGEVTEMETGPQSDSEMEFIDLESLTDRVCAFCDDGGTLLSCRGECLRSFHLTKLGFTREQVERTNASFWCKNCIYKQHQCYVCGMLGSSNNAAGAEVFQCEYATCGHFYHPRCVSKLVVGDDEVAAEVFQNSIISGGSFVCPLHKCYVCKQGENEKVKDLQFAVCRRCPKAYHRKCLPREIALVFEGQEEGLITRAREGLLHNNRILIYCLKHEIDHELRTPLRDHLKFP